VTSRLAVTVGATTLAEPFDIEWNDPLNRLGGFSFSLTNDDPDAASCVLGAMVAIAKDDAEVFYGRIEEIRQVDAQDSELAVTTFSGRRSVAELEVVRVFPPQFGTAGIGQMAGKTVSLDPWDSVRVLGWPDPARGAALYVDADGADDVTLISTSRPVGFPDPDAYWAGRIAGADDVYFTGQIAAGDIVSDRLTYWVAFGGEGELYHQGVLVLRVEAGDADQSKCWQITTKTNPDEPQVFTVRVRTAGTLSPNALFAFTCHDPLTYDERFFFKTRASGGQAWGMFADPATPPGITPGGAVIQLVDEFEARSGESLGWTFTFTDELDSAGDPWPIIPVLPCQIGDSLIDVLDRLADAWVEWGTEVDAGSRSLSMWNAPGVTLPDSSTGVGRGAASGVAIEVGVNALELVHEVTE
jgi:hypothetical protein